MAGWVWLLTACQPAAAAPTPSPLPPTATATPAPPRPTFTPSPQVRPTATPPAPSPAPPTAAPTSLWTQGGAWPLPETPLQLNIQAPSEVSTALWQEAVAAGTGASEIWLGQQADAWPGPDFPPQAHILFTDRRPGPSGYLVDVYFTMAPADLPALQQAFNKAGWRPLRNINPALAQMAPGLVLLEFYRGGQADENPLNLFLLQAAGENTLWARATLGPLSAAPPQVQPPPLPWHLTLPDGWQAEGSLAQENTADDRLRASAWQVAVPASGIQPEKAFAQWDADMKAQGWQKTDGDTQSTVAWASWAQGQRRRTLVLVTEPWRMENALVLAYTLTPGGHPAAGPQWHGTLSAAEGRRAALLALLFEDPQFSSPLTLTLGTPPEGTWPLAQKATLAFGRRSGNGTQAWLNLGETAAATRQAVEQAGWAWQTADTRAAAPALWGPLWPETSSSGRAPTLEGALCKGNTGYLARLWPRGTLALTAIPTLCAAFGETSAAQLQGLVLPPSGYPFAAYGALKGSYVGYNTGNILSVAAFWLAASPAEGSNWLKKAADALQSRHWTVEPAGPGALLARAAGGNPQALLFALPALDGQTLFGIVANR